MPVADCRILEWPQHRDARGALVAMERGAPVPFPIERVFALHDVPETGSRRGGHAHRSCHEILCALSGTVHVVLRDDRSTMRVTLDAAWKGVHVAPMTWLELELSPGAVCLVLCSHRFDEGDYLRHHDAYLSELVEGRAAAEKAP